LDLNENLRFAKGSVMRKYSAGQEIWYAVRRIVLAGMAKGAVPVVLPGTTRRINTHQ
jgi:hypothetical protein